MEKCHWKRHKPPDFPDLLLCLFVFLYPHKCLSPMCHPFKHIWTRLSEIYTTCTSGMSMASHQLYRRMGDKQTSYYSETLKVFIEDPSWVTLITFNKAMAMPAQTKRGLCYNVHIIPFIDLISFYIVTLTLLFFATFSAFLDLIIILLWHFTDLSFLTWKTSGQGHPIQ